MDMVSDNQYCAKPLAGNLAEYYSYRAGNYRILFEIEKKNIIDYVEKIARREKAY
ncbi:MAG TPA: type II toxin-antitoxin system RelE/ParE family toxin [bacterium]|nr:type II toxin-antitoxin system RelE/ParE family toxin [bacterium]